MEVRNSQFAAFIENFTANTYVMVVSSDTSIRKWIHPLGLIQTNRFPLAPASETTLWNIRNSRKYFEQLESVKNLSSASNSSLYSL